MMSLGLQHDNLLRPRFGVCYCKCSLMPALRVRLHLAQNVTDPKLIEGVIESVR